MAAYRKRLILPESGKLTLTDLPFPAGADVEVSIVQEPTPQTDNGRKWAAMFQQTDAEPQIQRLSESEIAQEIESHRAFK